METDRHRQQMVLLIQTLKLAWAYRLSRTGDVYERLAPDQRGVIPCEQLGLAVREGEYEGEGGEWLRFIGPGGEAVPTPEEQVLRERRSRDVERERADAEQKRAASLEARVRELEAKLREPH